VLPTSILSTEERIEPLAAATLANHVFEIPRV
jgi:hypothetical protein